MKYEDMINGLAGELLEKIANEEVEELEKEAGLAKTPVHAIKQGAKRVGELATGSKVKNLKNAHKTVNEAIDFHKKTPDVFDRENTMKFLMNNRKNIRNELGKEQKAVRNFRVGAGAAGAAGVGAGAYALKKNKVQEKAASYFEEAEFLKQAAEEAYQEAIMMQDAAVALYNRMEEE